MSLKKWENVLLEWVNCLKLSAPIQSIQDLKDGNFFTNLLKLLIPLEDNISKHIVSRIQEFLQEHYPNIVLNDDNLQDLANTDLIVMSSLLLHYSCIHDRRDVLTSPLCYQLSKTTQTAIKVYLEKTTNDIKQEDLFNIIETSLGSLKRHKNVTLIHNYTEESSPLQAFLHTPISKVPRLREKDKEINKLRSELDLERFEKIDLQKELDIQKEKNKNLNQQIHNKTLEITKLHNEISDLETKLASNTCNYEWTEMEKRLRCEINSLEEYISRLNNEQDKLSEEKDKTEEQLKNLQIEYNFWQEKAISLEANYEKVSEKHEQQQCELANLRRHCCELTGLLDELKSTKRINDSCEEIDLSTLDDLNRLFSDEPSTEDLACEVVEVQLRDVQKENTDLKNSLKDNQENIMKLNNEVFNFKIKIRQLEGEKEILETENEDLHSKVTLLIKTREMLDRTKNQLEQTTIKLQDVLNHNDFLTSNVIIKDKQLLEAQDVIQSLRNSNTEITTSLNTLDQDYKNLQTTLTECEERLFNTKSAYDNISGCFIKLKNNTKSIVGKFEHILPGLSGLDAEDFQQTFMSIFNELERDRMRQEKDKQLHADDIVRLEKLIAMQKKEIVLLNEREQNNLNEIDKLSNDYKTTKEEVSILEQTVASYVDKIKTLNGTISEMKITQTELDLSKTNLEEKLVNLENQIQIYNNNEESIKRIVLELKTDLNYQPLGFEQYLNVLQLEIKNLMEKISNLKDNLDKTHEEIAQYELNKQKYEEEIKESRNILEKTKAQHEEVKEKLRVVQKAKKKLSKESNSSKINYEKEISSLKDSLEIFEEQVERLTSSELKLRQEHDKCISDIATEKMLVLQKQCELKAKDTAIESIKNEMQLLKDENESFRTKNKDLNDECVKYRNVNKNVDKKCKELEKNMRVIVQELALKNDEINAVVLKNKDYQEKFETKIEVLEKELSNATEELNTQISFNKQQQQEYEQKVMDLNSEIDLYRNKEKEFVIELNETKDELNITVLKYTEALQAHKEFQAESETQINNLTENLHELIKKYNVLDDTHQDTIRLLDSVQSSFKECKQNEIRLKENICVQQQKFEDELNNNSLDFNLKIKSLEEKETELVRNLEATIEELQLFKSNNKEIYFGFQQLCVVVAYEKIHTDKLRKKIKDVYSMYKKLRDSFEELKNIALPFTTSHNCNVQLSRCLKKMVDENNNLRKFISDLEREFAVLQNEYEDLKLNLQKFHDKHEEINLLKKENESQKQSLNTLIEEKEELQKLMYFEQNGYELKLNDLRSVNDVLITEKVILEEKIKEANSLDTIKTKEILNLEALVNSKNEEIVLKTSELKDISMKNSSLELDLSYLKESLNATLQKFNDLEQISETEKGSFAEQNNKINEDLSWAQKEIESLKEKLKTVFVERQALELETKVANEKIVEYESFVRKKETDVGDANSKLVTKLEEILRLEKCRQALQVQVDELGEELNQTKKEKEELKECYEKYCEKSESERTKFEKDAIEEQKILLKRIEALEFEKECFEQTKALLEEEKFAKEVLEIKLSDVVKENSKLSETLLFLKNNIQNQIHVLSETPFEIHSNENKELSIEDLVKIKDGMGMLEEKVLRIKEQNKIKIEQLGLVEKEKLRILEQLEKVTEKKTAIENEKQQFLQELQVLQAENNKKANDLQELKNLEIAHEVSKAKYEQLKEHQRNIDVTTSQHSKLQENFNNLEKKVFVIHDTCKKFAGHSTTYKTAIDKLVTERNFVESILSKVWQGLISLQTKTLNANDERDGLKLKDQVESFEFIVEDLQKQFLQISKKIHSIILSLIGIPTKIYDVVTSGKCPDATALFENIDFEEELEKITDCRTSANNLLDQISNFETILGPKLAKLNKENVLKNSTTMNSDFKVKDEDLKKKNTILKQRLTLSENAKGNLEKKVKQLRQENKLLQEKSDTNMETGYKALLHEHIELKEKLQKSQERNAKLLQEFENYKIKHTFLPDQIKYEKSVKSELESKLEKEVIKLRDAYGNLMSDHSKIDLENATLRKLLEDRTSQLSDLSLIKEAYEKLLEENNTFRMEVDTLKYKRNKDREALLEATKKAQDLKIEYELKFEKMKAKALQLCKEEMNKENRKYQSEKNMLLKKIAQQNELLEKKFVETNIKLRSLDSGDMESYSSGDSFFLAPEASHLQSTRNSIKTTDDLVSSRSRRVDDRKSATLPKTAGMLVIQENQEFQRKPLHSVQPPLAQNLEMEDETDEIFNNKYLADLKEGRCVFPSNLESNVNRLSELKWRNSLCPPHLKSSYPAETQFNSPSQFKEDDIKSGVVEFDDSMSTKLIQGEKPRKKDIGTTSYKKPGPPTPSKNGGRMSLQGNEKEALREHNDAPKTPKRNTPSRLKYLFMGRNLSTKDNSENQPGTPRSKRLSIFRKQK